MWPFPWSCSMSEATPYPNLHALRMFASSNPHSLSYLSCLEWLPVKSRISLKIQLKIDEDCQAGGCRILSCRMPTAVWYPTSMQILAGLHSSIRWFRGGSKMCTWCEKWHYSNISIYIYIWPEVKEVKKWQDVFWEYSLDSIRNRFSNIS